MNRTISAAGARSRESLEGLLHGEKEKGSAFQINLKNSISMLIGRV